MYPIYYRHAFVTKENDHLTFAKKVPQLTQRNWFALDSESYTHFNNAWVMGMGFTVDLKPAYMYMSIKKYSYVKIGKILA